MILQCIAFLCLELVLHCKFADFMLVNHSYVIVTMHKLSESVVRSCLLIGESYNNYYLNSYLTRTYMSITWCQKWDCNF